MNRRWTFGLRGREQATRQHLMSLGVLALTLLMTSGGLALLHLWQPQAPTGSETAVLAVGTACSTLVRFLAMRLWIFRAPAVEAQSRALPAPAELVLSSTAPAAHDAGHP
jgi:putative flippase GtrA